jgi:hypothetical protein
VNRQTRIRTWVPPLALALVLLGAAAEATDGADDRFVAGYATAVLQREFRLAAPSLRVRDGVVRLDAADLAGADTAAVTRALTSVPGVVRVEIAKAGAPASAAPSAPGARRSSPAAPAATGFLPGADLFRPLVADPRWPHLSVSRQSYLRGRGLGDVLAASFGETVPVYRDEWRSGTLWELGLFGAVFAILDLDTPSWDLVNADYVLGGFGAARRGAVSGLVRLFHQSSHLGDELVLHHPIERVNLSYEALDVKLSWDVTDALRLYGGAGVLLRREPDDLGRGSLQAGAELRGPRVFGRVRPILAGDLQSRELNDWSPDLSLRTGLLLEGDVEGRSLQLLLEYFNGHSPNGQFLRESVEYLGLGLHLHF